MFNLLELNLCKGEPFTLSEAQKWCEVENKYTIRRVCEKYFRSTNKNPKNTIKINKTAVNIARGG